MFYPEDSLKRGGRFYLCWVADSWPLRFATITHRQLWSQDIRRICDDLLEVMTNESGRPTQRFSLRLSSQLLRGLVRLYQRKVNVLLGDLCMINSYVIKNANKKWIVQETKPVRHVRRPLQQLEVHEVVQEPEETEQRIEELIQASGNAVANIQDITLREPTHEISENALMRPNDGFGEENLDQPLQLLQDRTIEMMLVNTDVSAAHVHSGLELALDTTDKSHDKSRLNVREAQMERISEHDLTMFRKSTAEELIPQFEKDIPEIPEIPPPELPVPLPEKPQEPVVEEPRFVPVEPPREPEIMEIELEELEVEPQSRRRRRRNRLIIDKRIKISTQVFRARLENPLVELRCEDSSDDIISIRVPPEQYFARPCHGGMGIRSNIGFDLSRLYSRNLGVMRVQPREDRELEEVRQRNIYVASRSVLERIEEEPEVPVVPVEPQMPEQITTEVNVTADALNVTEAPRVSAVEQMELDFADMPTQKIETLSQARKRAAEEEASIAISKRPRSCGYMSFRESQKAKQLEEDANLDADKENRPENLQQLRNTGIRESRQEEITDDLIEAAPVQNQEKIISSMLQEVGLADIQSHPTITVEADVHTTHRGSHTKSGRGNQSDSSETPLGSLDRTKVSLGDSEQTTDSKRFIRDQWGTEGTMLKILKLKAGRQPVNVRSLLSKGPILPGHKRVIAARCFTSILKLKQHGFINVVKDPGTLEINDISLGTKLTSSQEQI